MRCLLKTIYWVVLAVVLVATALSSLYLRQSNSLQVLIVEKAAEHDLDPRLALALVHASSRCQPSWSEGDRFGLLALSRADVEAANRRPGTPGEVFDLFDPEANLDIGFRKYLAIRATWLRQREPDAWALVEWLAGREKARNWAARAMPYGSATEGVADQRLRAQIDGILARLRPCSLSLVWPGREGGPP